MSPKTSMRISAICAAAVAAATLSVSLAAVAQDLAPPPPHDTSNDALGPGGDHPAGPGAAWSLERREQWVQRQLESAQSSGAMPADRAGRALQALQHIQAEQAQLSKDHGGLTQTDTAYLAGRIDRLRGRAGLAAAPWGQS